MVTTSTMSSFITAFITIKSALLSSVLILFIVGLVDYAIITEPNGCDMTFMFQYPQFVLLPLREQIALKYPNYHLFAYGEGQYTDTLLNGDFKGVPVVFVPGNGGSFKQVRSLGSVALRMSDKYSTFHFNYFTIDFNEEYSGVNSFQLQSQTLFLKESLLKIMDLYENKGRNVSLVLIGHSIGGLIIRSLLSLPEFDPYVHRVDLVITLATPHKSPVVPIDSRMTSFYDDVEEYWATNRDNFGHMNVISIGGGFNDKLVRSHLTKLNDDHPNDLTVVSTAIDDVWVSTDHLCIVWCKQLTLKITRLLFDLTDKKSLKLVDNIADRNRIIRYHFMERTLGKNFPAFVIPDYITLAPTGEWTENYERIIKFTKPKVLQPNYILLPLMRRESIVIQFEGHYRHDWVMACSAVKKNNVTLCDKGRSLHHYVRRLPSKPKDVERRLFTGLSSLLLNQGFTHLLLAISSSVEPVDIQIDRFTTSIRSRTIQLPALWQSIVRFFAWSTVMDIAVSEETTFYNVTLAGLRHVWSAYCVQMETISCYPTAVNMGYLYLTIPWNRENQHQYVYPKRGSTARLTFKLNSPKPKTFDPSLEPTLYLLVDPNCSYKLHIKASLAEMMGQLLRHYSLVLLPMIVSLVLSLLSIQIIPNNSSPNQSSKNNSADNNHHFFDNKPKYIYIQSVHIIKNIRLVSINGLLVLSASGSAIFFNYTSKNSLTADLTIGQTFTLYTFLYVIALSITYFFLIIITAMFICFSTVLDYFKTKLISSQYPTNTGRKDFVTHEKVFKIKLIPALSAVVLAIICIAFNSALTFLVCLILHNIQLIYLSIKCQSIERRLGADSTASQWNLHLTLMALLYASTIPTIPLLMDWINLKMPVLYFYTAPTADPYLIPALMLTIACPVLWHQYSVIDTNLNKRYIFSYALKAMAILSSIVCQMNYWNISLIICVSVFVVSAQHLTDWYSNRHLKRD